MAADALGDWVDLRLVAEPPLTNRLLEEGLILFRCEPDAEEFLTFVRHVLAIQPHRDADERGLTTIRAVRSLGRRRPSYQAFSRRALRLHTDGTSLPRPPSVVALLCVERARSGGLTTLADGAEIYHAIDADASAVAEALAHVDAASFGATPGHVDAVFRRLPDGRIAFRYRDDELIRFDPGARGSVRYLRHFVQRSTRTLDLSPGMGYILQNTRWLHGRTAYRGRRLVVRIVGNAVSPEIDAGLAGFTLTELMGPTRPPPRRHSS